jgi:GAF domain-containing protein
MKQATRDRMLLETFAMLADTLVVGYDIVDLLQALVDACRDLLGVTAAGILLAENGGELELMASTSEASHLVEMMQLGAHAGPCIESYREGAMVSVPSIAQAPAEWSAFKGSALAQGFASAEAIPLRLREKTIGTLNLFRSESGTFPADDLIAARAFADVATIGILHERSLRDSEVLAQQLQGALNSRVIIEQAKGVVSFTNDVPIDHAFTLLRDYSRSHNLPLTSVAARVVARQLRLDAPDAPAS